MHCNRLAPMTSSLPGERSVRVGLKKQTQDYVRGRTPSVGRLQQEDSPCKVPESDNPLAPSKAGSVSLQQDRCLLFCI